ncbi:MAG: hypothetical protein ILP11_00145 [Alphaproteobacteria bacterium]|nr:hypothetical protein [Alphaproteobacteria bacterium]
MKVRIMSPIGTVLEQEVEKLSFESLSGARTFLPNHIDTVSALPPNIMTVRTMAHKDIYVACTQGVLVKQGPLVLISAHKAVIGDDLEHLASLIKTEFAQDEDNRRQVNMAIARLEAQLSRGFMNLKGT